MDIRKQISISTQYERVHEVWLAMITILVSSHRIMQACVDTAFAYVHERKQFNRRIGEFQMMQVSFRRVMRWPTISKKLLNRLSPSPPRKTDRMRRGARRKP